MWKDGTAVWKNAFHVFKLLHLRINRIHFICGAYIPGVLNRHNVLLQVDGTKTGRVDQRGVGGGGGISGSLR